MGMVAQAAGQSSPFVLLLDPAPDPCYMAVFGLIGCYVCIGLFFFGFLLLSHGTV